MIRGACRRAAAAMMAVMVVVAAGGGPADAGPAWRQVRSAEDGFAAAFPGTARFESHPVAGLPGAVQHDWTLNPSKTENYRLSVTAYPPGTLPEAPDFAFYQRLVTAYAHGTRTRLRNRYAKTISGHPGMEAIFDDDATGNGLHHLLDIVAVGDRLYMVISAGPDGHAASAGAARFRDSFRLTGD